MFLQVSNESLFLEFLVTREKQNKTKKKAKQNRTWLKDGRDMDTICQCWVKAHIMNTQW